MPCAGIPSRSANDPLLDKIFAPGEMSKMLGEVDVLVAAAPLTPETQHMVGESAFRGDEALGNRD